MTHIQLEGSFNTRDLGGYYNKDNLIIKRGLLYRSDKLTNLTDNDINKLKNLGIKRIIDFRTKKEKSKHPNTKILENLDYFEYIEEEIDTTTNLEDRIYQIVEHKLHHEVKSYLVNVNKDFILKHNNHFEKILKLIINDKKPTLFHCSAGKDRTGYLAYLIYTLLDLKEDTIIQDYLDSNKYLKDDIENIVKLFQDIFNLDYEDAMVFKPLFGVELEYIISAIDTMYSLGYKKVGDYIENELNIDSSIKNQYKNYLIEK